MAESEKALLLVYNQRQKIEGVFREFDEHGNGAVSEEEFSMGLELLGVDVNMAPLAQLMVDCTLPGGMVDFVSFLAKVRPASAAPKPPGAKPAPPPKPPPPGSPKPAAPASKPPPPGSPKPGKPPPPPAAKPAPPPPPSKPTPPHKPTPPPKPAGLKPAGLKPPPPGAKPGPPPGAKPGPPPGAKPGPPPGAKPDPPPGAKPGPPPGAQPGPPPGRKPPPPAKPFMRQGSSDEAPKKASEADLMQHATWGKERYEEELLKLTEELRTASHQSRLKEQKARKEGMSMRDLSAADVDQEAKLALQSKEYEELLNLSKERAVALKKVNTKLKGVLGTNNVVLPAELELQLKDIDDQIKKDNLASRDRSKIVEITEGKLEELKAFWAKGQEAAKPPLAAPAAAAAPTTEQIKSKDDEIKKLKEMLEKLQASGGGDPPPPKVGGGPPPPPPPPGT